MAELDELQQALALARAGLRAPQAAKLRVRARLGGLAASGLRSESEAPPEALAPGLGRGAVVAPLAKLARHPVAAWMAAVLAGGGFGSGYWLGGAGERGGSVADAVGTERGAASAVAAREAESPGRTPGESSTAIDSAAPAAHEPESPARTAASEPVSTPPRATRHAARERGLGGELALLQRAERAIRAGNSALALVLLDELDGSFPVSVLREERRAARLLAECEQAKSSGEGAAAEGPARERAAQFLVEHAGSVYSDRIRSLCGLAASDVSGTNSEGSASPGHSSP